MAPPKTRHRWFRFSLRSLFVAVTVICVWLGWNLNTVRERQKIRNWVVANGGTVVVGEKSFIWFVFMVSSNGHMGRARKFDFERLEQQCVVPLQRRWLGDEEVYCIFMPFTANEADVRQAIACFPGSEILASMDYPNHRCCPVDSSQ